jgi:hypothetical protein
MVSPALTLTYSCHSPTHPSPLGAVGHGALLEAAREGLDAAGWDGVLLGGNYVCGVALGKCVEHGYEFAEQLAAKVAATPLVTRQEAAAAGAA